MAILLAIDGALLVILFSFSSHRSTPGDRCRGATESFGRRSTESFGRRSLLPPGFVVDPEEHWILDLKIEALPRDSLGMAAGEEWLKKETITCGD